MPFLICCHVLSNPLLICRDVFIPTPIFSFFLLENGVLNVLHIGTYQVDSINDGLLMDNGRTVAI
jgi:hypothetical protein